MKNSWSTITNNSHSTLSNPSDIYYNAITHEAFYDPTQLCVMCTVSEDAISMKSYKNWLLTNLQKSSTVLTVQHCCHSTKVTHFSPTRCNVILYLGYTKHTKLMLQRWHTHCRTVTHWSRYNRKQVVRGSTVTHWSRYNR